MKKAATYLAGNSLQDAANSLLVSINSLFGAIKFRFQASRYAWKRMVELLLFGDACLWGCMILSPGAKSEGATFRPSLR
jgi:hypothetical protein